MPPIRIDTDKSGFSVKPAGDYDAVIAGVKYKGLSKGDKTKGAHSYSIKFALDEGGTVWDNFYVAAETFWRIKALWVAAGMDPEALSGQKTFLTQDEVDSGEYDDETDVVVLDDLFAELLEQPVRVQLTVRPATDQYAEKNEIKKYLPASSGLSGWASAA